MKIVIDISEETYNEVCWRGLQLCPRGDEELVNAIKNGTPRTEKPAEWKDGYCSNCGCDVPAYIIDLKWQKDMSAKYCPNCGARMRGVEE